MTHHIESPAWIKRAFVIHHWDFNQSDSYTDLFCKNLKADLKSALYVEFCEIYKGLCCQMLSVSCVSVSDKNIYFLKPESHLLLAFNLCESHETDVIDNCSKMFVWSVISYFMPCGTDVSSKASNDNFEWNTKRRSTADRHNSVNGRNEHTCLLYSRSMEKHKNKLDSKFNKNFNTCMCRNVNIDLYIASLVYTDALY